MLDYCKNLAFALDSEKCVFFVISAKTRGNSEQMWVMSAPVTGSPISLCPTSMLAAVRTEQVRLCLRILTLGQLQAQAS